MVVRRGVPKGCVNTDPLSRYQSLLSKDEVVTNCKRTDPERREESVGLSGPTNCWSLITDA